MYCPYCATRLAATATRCNACDHAVQPFDHAVVEAHRSRAAQIERWKRQRHQWGLLLVMGSLLVVHYVLPTMYAGQEISVQEGRKLGFIIDNKKDPFGVRSRD